MFYMEGGDIYITRGDTAVFRVEASFIFPTGYDEEEKPVMITPTLSVKKNLSDTDYVMQIPHKGEICTSAKSFPIVLRAEDTNVEPGSYYYDVQLVYESDGEKHVYTIGPYRFIVLNDVTR